MITYQQLQEAAQAVESRVGKAEIALVLGSGLGGYAAQLSDAQSIAYSEIPYFPVSTVPGHAGKWFSGELCGKRVYLLQGRVHLYEGYGMDEVTAYVRVLSLLGVKTLILTNAAGCVNTAWQPGDLMLLSDYINYTGQNPLIGANMDEFGPRFPDMSCVYDRELRRLCLEEAGKLGLTGIREGVYMWFTGPMFETPAEIRMARIVGADAVGMSTVPESIAARHCGIRLLAVSCLTNMAAGILDQPLTHEEVQETASRVEEKFTALLNAAIRVIG